MSIEFIVILITALVFDFLNGFHDSSNIVATPIASRALSPRAVLWLAAIAHFIGPFLFGTAVAKTIGEEIVNPNAITLNVVLAAMLSAVLWNLITWYLGIPSSSSHALIGGLIGAVIVSVGVEALKPQGLIVVTVALFASPVLGLFAGYLLMKATLFLARGASPRINWFFKRIQIFSAFGLALSHGANDAQKTMGIITMALVIEGVATEFIVPIWVTALSAGMIAIGTATGGWRLIRTLGWRIYQIRPIHGFVSQFAGAGVILGAALFGGPVSTTQVMSSAIMGAGSAERITKVRWTVGREMLIAWILTIPAAALMAALLYWPIQFLF
ncbi:MAG: inorganic phosphate transporter [Anaerolineae bacterium]|nr:inorganic phosphate transporter [Anaerolineae bacterium]MCO5188384.1 inorganic phosphate transporter [Anaerolineae bacterium]MCO5195065.1 inorganic phosphate transporter [Anaerolineae bacterium]MCO5197253.1 inorganic phosphate transporter [Anaerolineae bacterium]MCO5204809.1 inorganic phosphate transporter [Anaerolineae bacterium]